MQARRIARELALLGMGQLPNRPEKLAAQSLEELIAAAVRSLAGETRDALETASADLERSQERLLSSETRATDVSGARAMVQDAIAATQEAINRLGDSLQIPTLVQTSNQKEVRSYALELLRYGAQYRTDVDADLDEVMVAWQVKRLAQIDRDILRIAVIEMQYLGLPDRIAINEAVELAKRYSDEDGYRFINGVLRRWFNQYRKHQSGITQPDAPGGNEPQSNAQSSLV
ncbi:MAG: transcription antitermination factor NusB [Cyanobacteria bacterium]|nr:transcription antitermination factor NusB [Cyanobacteriota bacterium]MDA0866652.1 transcription antitermination factor NusB [Cyanobacteriota bacterium]